MGGLERWDARTRRWVDRMNARHAEESRKGGLLRAIGGYLSFIAGLVGLVGLVIEAIGALRER